MIIPLIKTTIFATIILFSATMMLQESYAEPLRDCTWYEMINYDDHGTGIIHYGDVSCIVVSSAPIAQTAAIPDWVDQNFKWYGEGLISQTELINAIKYLIDNDIMILDPERAGVKVKFPWEADTPDVFGTDFSLVETAGGAETWAPHSWHWVVHKASTTGTQAIGEILDAGVATEDDWEDVINQIAIDLGYDTTESVVYELQGIVVLASIEIYNETQRIDAQLEMIGEWLEIISEKQESYSFDAADVGTSDTTESAKDQSSLINVYSELGFITWKLERYGEQISSLETGINVLDEKLQTVGDDAQLANIDLQNALQKQQQTLQMLSNVSKTYHDATLSIMNKLR